MGLAAILAATLTVGPTAASDSGFPSATDSIPFTLNPNPKAFAVDTGPQRPLLNSPSAFVALSGVGTGQSVTNATTLYLRVVSPIQVRLTYKSDATPKVSYVSGVLLIETDPQFPITLVEAQGAGQIEYWAGGPQ